MAPPPLMSHASSGTSPVVQKRKGPSRHPPLKATPLLVKKKPIGRWLVVEKSKGRKLWWVTTRRRGRLNLLHQLCHWAACHQVTPCLVLYAFDVGLLSQVIWLTLSKGACNLTNLVFLCQSASRQPLSMSHRTD